MTTQGLSSLAMERLLMPTKRERLRGSWLTGLRVRCLFCGWHPEIGCRPVSQLMPLLCEHFERTHGRVVVCEDAD